MHLNKSLTHNAGLWVPLAAITKRGRQGGGAALII